jgi:hypothetical protein
MVNIATAPLRRPNYQVIGRQLYICEEAVTTERPVGTSDNSRTGNTGSNTSSSSATTLQRSNSSSSSSDSAVVAKTPSASEQQQQWWSKLPFSSSFMFLPSAEGEGDDDNVDIAAATAVAGGIVPDRLPRRTLFPMHRMLTYRTRLLSICQDALSGHRWPISLLPASSTLSYTLPHVPNIPHPDDIVLSELIAPGMFPLKAEASVPSSVCVVPHAVARAESSSFSNVPNPRVPLVVAARQKLTWPLRVLLNNRPGKGDGTSDNAAVDVVVRIEGRGLCNVTAAWVSGCVDANSGKSTPIDAEILSIPRAPLPSQIANGGGGGGGGGATKKSKSSGGGKGLPLMEPVSALASWVAMAVGWQSLLRQLQTPSRSDYLLAKVKLPASTVRAAHRGRSDPFTVAVGEGPKLMVHLQSDFAVHSLPLSVTVVDDGSGGGGGGGGNKNKNQKSTGEVQKRYKDANQFLRNAKSGLPHL